MIKKYLSSFLFAVILLSTISLQIQDAYAAQTFDSAITGAAGGNSASTTNIVLTFSGTIYTLDGAQDGSNQNESALFAVTNPAITVNTANIISHANGVACGGQTTVTLVLASALDTDATPTVTFTNDGNVQACNDDADVADQARTAADGLSPTMDSASKISATTIKVTFSEDLTGGTVAAGDFTVSGSSVNSVSEENGIVTLTLGNALGEDATPTVTLAGGVDDASANTNTLSAGPSVTASDNTPNIPDQNGAGCSGDCEAPTLGIDSRGDRYVTDGFTYNGHPTNVERFFTPYPLITAEVGKQNKAVFKIYDNYGVENIKHFEFAFGLGKDQVISQSNAMIGLDIAPGGTNTVTVVDPENALDNVSVSTNVGDCNGEPGIECMIVTINHMFRAPLDFNIVGTNVWDTRLNGWQNYYNHGIEVVGESMNPPNEYEGIYKGHIYHLIEIENNRAIDEYGDMWTYSSGQWTRDYVKHEKILDDVTITMTRTHSGFAELKSSQIELAEQKMQEICPTCNLKFDDLESSYSHHFVGKLSKLQNPVIVEQMQVESDKAQEKLSAQFEYLYGLLHGKDLADTYN